MRKEWFEMVKLEVEMEIITKENSLKIFELNIMRMSSSKHLKQLNMWKWKELCCNPQDFDHAKIL